MIKYEDSFLLRFAASEEHSTCVAVIKWCVTQCEWKDYVFNNKACQTFSNDKNNCLSGWFCLILLQLWLNDSTCIPSRCLWAPGFCFCLLIMIKCHRNTGIGSTCNVETAIVALGLCNIWRSCVICIGILRHICRSETSKFLFSSREFSSDDISLCPVFIGNALWLMWWLASLSDVVGCWAGITISSVWY